MSRSRIDEAFARLKAEHRTGLVAYVTAGDPDLRRSADVIRGVAAGGADVIEVGVPFSDPLADGPEIQRASERALAAGTTLDGVLHMVAELRRDLETPLVLFTYANPVVRMGLETFARRAADAGIDGVLLLDIPLEHGLAPIFLLSPTTTDARVRRASDLGQGFLYVISRLGVTGVRDAVATDAEALVERIRRHSDLPIALGFGLSRPDHIADVGHYADAAVVGSALVAHVKAHADSPRLAEDVRDFVRWLRGGVPA
jgi:tryptophan synthase alpha chain